MSEGKTVMRRIRPIRIRCGAAGCTQAQDAAIEERDDEGIDFEIIAPKGWTFPSKDPQSTRDVVVGRCPLHTKA
jgi:hypothetical protein